MANTAAENRWKRYFHRQEGRGPRPGLVEALNRFKTYRGYAIELGSGAGIECKVLLNAGWEVLAVDIEPLAIEILSQSLLPEFQSKLQTWNIGFEDLPPLPPADLVHAAYSLPFCHPKYFLNLWENLSHAIKPGGRFTGQLFGPKDDWAADTHKTFHTIQQIRDLFRGFILEDLEKEERDGIANGAPKH